MHLAVDPGREQQPPQNRLVSPGVQLIGPPGLSDLDQFASAHADEHSTIGTATLIGYARHDVNSS
jgi:hypothetical protein